MSLKKFILDCLFPKKCYGCQQNDTWLCQACFKKLVKYQGDTPRVLTNARDLIIAGEYQDALLAALITAFKFNFNQELKVPLFAFLKAAIDTQISLNYLSNKPWQNILIIPIPLDKKRKNWRGFNQSELIAKEISNYYNWPLSLALIKIKKNKIQAELKEDVRILNQTGVFCWQGENLIGQDIILVDDLITTGATMNEAELILKKAGANKVIKVALAKG
jgi:ComF family protein